jgi:hypothetical protein
VTRVLDTAATKRARALHAAGVKRLNEFFAYDPADAAARREDRKLEPKPHGLRSRRRKEKAARAMRRRQRRLAA